MTLVFNRKVVMSVDEILKAVDELSESDLENLANRVRSVRMHRKPSVLSSQETALLLKINYALPEELHQEFLLLRDRRDAEIITDAENNRLSDVSDRIELLAAERAEAMVELANLRQVPLMQLMDDLGIAEAGVR
jgi:hypothetical protein